MEIAVYLAKPIISTYENFKDFVFKVFFYGCGHHVWIEQLFGG